MTFQKTKISAALLAAAILSGGILATKTAHAGNYGCYEVVAPGAINIRKHAWSKSEILTTASKGTILIKWKAICALRGFWCPVQKGSIKGHAAKKYLVKVDCP